MKPVAQVVLTGALVGGAGFAAWTFLPKLQAPSTVVATEAGMHSETARRLIDLYDPTADVAHAAVGRSGIATDLTGERISTLVENDSPLAQDVLDQEATRVNDLLKATANRIRQHDQRFGEITGETTSTIQGAVNFGNNTGTMSRHMTEGLAESHLVAQSNTSLLKSASSASAKGLQATSGEASGRDSLIGNRTHGIALFHEGMAMDRQARLVRSDADDQLIVLSELLARQMLLAEEANIVEDSGVRDAIKDQEDRVAEARNELDAIATSIDGVQGRIESIKSDIESQTMIATTLRKQLDDLESRGVDFSAQGAGDAFEREYQNLSGRYRVALSLIHALQKGTITGARYESGSDQTPGQYVPNKAGGTIEYEPGQVELERHLVQLRRKESGAKQIHEDETAELDRLNGLQSANLAKAEAARTAMAAGAEKAKTLLDSYQALTAETIAIEDNAISTFKKASQAFAAAKRAAQSRSADLPQMSPEKEERSPAKLIKNERWLEAQMASQSADSGTRASMVLYDRFIHLKQATTVFESLADVFPNLDLNTDEMKSQIAQAKTDAEAILDDAIGDFENASRNFKQHWSVAASVAAADYMLALFDNPRLVNVAIANYQSVVKDRETDPVLRPFIERLEQLRNR